LPVDVAEVDQRDPIEVQFREQGAIITQDISRMCVAVADAIPRCQAL
jgi:hypothetical protein